MAAVVLLAATLGQSCGGPPLPGGTDPGPGEQVLDYRPDSPTGQPPVDQPGPGTTGGPAVGDSPTVAPAEDPLPGPASVSVEVLAAPAEGPEPLSVTFTAILGSQVPGPVVNWDFGDGSTGTGLEVTHTYAQAAVYTVTACLALGAGSSCGQRDVSVTHNAGSGGTSGPGPTPPSPPTLTAASGQTFQGSPVTLVVSGSDPAGGDLTFSIVAQPSHGTLGPVNNASVDSASVLYTPAPDFYGTDTFTFTAVNAAGTPAQGPAVCTIQVKRKGSLTVSPAGGLASAGSPGGPFSPAHVTFTLSNEGQARLSWTVGKSQPWVGLSKTTGALDPGNIDVVTVSVLDAAGVLGLGTYADTVTFTALDGSGTTSRPVSLLVSAAPVADAGPDFSVEDLCEDGYQSVTLDGGASTPVLGRIVNYRWTEDGTVLADGPASLANVTLSAGRHVVTLTVTDESGQTGSDQVAVVVQQRLLSPGSGWTGATEPPAAAGTPGQPGYDEKAIARWDVVPYQTFDGEFNVGVVAFHINGIDRVDFSVNGGPWTAVYEMKLNPQVANHSGVGVQSDGVVEYWATLDASRFAQAGPLEVRAVAYPKVGEPRVLPGLQLFADPDGSLSSKVVYVSTTGSDTAIGTIGAPKATIGAAFGAAGDGGIVIINDAGTYVASTLWGPTYQRFVTIRSADHLGRNDVVITGPSGGRILNQAARVRWEKVTFDDGASSYDVNSYFTAGKEIVWFDNVRFTSTAAADPATGIIPSGSIQGNTRAVYITSSVRDRGFNGLRELGMVRNCEVFGIQEDAYTNTQMILTSTAHDILIAPGAHSDIYQVWGGQENVIVYGLRAWNCRDTQAVMLGGEYTEPGEYATQNTAFVNIEFNMATGPAGTLTVLSQLSQTHRHTLFLNVKWIGQNLIFRTDDTQYPFRAKNVIFRDCKVPQYTLDRNGSPHWATGSPLPDGVFWYNLTSSN